MRKFILAILLLSILLSACSGINGKVVEKHYVPPQVVVDTNFIVKDNVPTEIKVAKYVDEQFILKVECSNNIQEVEVSEEDYNSINVGDTYTCK